MTIRTQELIAKLELQTHPEGGHYREIYRSQLQVLRHGEQRSALTTIYFLLCQGEFSRWHVVESDEVWHFYEGDGLELITYDPQQQRLEKVVLGAQLDGFVSVHVVPAGYWQAAQPCGNYALVGCSVAPGFEFTDFGFVVDEEDYEAAFLANLGEYKHLL